MIVVGVDGSQAALAAAGWAAREAALRGDELSLVHVMPAWPLEISERDRYADVGRWMREGATSMLDAALERVRQEDLRVAAQARLLGGDPRAVLIEVAAGAGLLAVGNHGLGGFTGMLLGSVALGVAGRAACPVAVVRDPLTPPGGEVVVGVDGSATGADALGFAFAEASLRGTGLRAVHVWNSPVVGGGPSALRVAQEAAEAERRLLAEALAGWSERHPDVTVTEQVEHGHPVHVLAEVSAHAGLLVVGSRGLGDLAGLLTGSVSHSLLHHATCPLVVTPAPASRGPS
ncbi:universal stress protein [Streptosporangium sp. NPDC050855]|uniref:universal stress protein n=1 Tax=Streptosporangium sp. NPDC050855 TaxID=3366194 RepID=UPI0037873A27